MDFSTLASKDEEKKEIVDGETGEVLERAKVVENHEVALTFPKAVAFQYLTLEEKAYVYAVHKAAEKILGDRLKAMNVAIKDEMSKDQVVKAEWNDVRVVHDMPATPEPEKSIDMDKLVEAMGMDHEQLVRLGLLKSRTTFQVRDRIREDVEARGLGVLSSEMQALGVNTLEEVHVLVEEAMEKATVTTTPKPRSDRIIVTAIGELKKTLAGIKKKALPQKARGEK